jgi:hypothetical protein
VFPSVAITAVSVPAGGVVYDDSHDDSHVLARGVALNKVVSLELSKYDVGTVNSSIFFEVSVRIK